VRAVRITATVARWLAAAAAVAAGLLALTLWDDGWWASLAVVAAIPAVVLWLFSASLFEVAQLPERLRGAPQEVAQLRGALEELREARGTGALRSLWRAGRRTASARDLATPWAPLLPLLSVWFLAATAASALLVPLVVLAALVALAVAI
jgi:membrane protein implicated in regulation of membrane protease activity